MTGGKQNSLADGWTVAASSEDCLQPTVGAPDDVLTGSTPARQLAGQKGAKGVKRIGLDPELRHFFVLNHNRLREAATNLITAAKEEDPVSRVLALAQISELLDGVWEKRKARDRSWQAIINHLRLILKQISLERLEEKLTPEQCNELGQIIDHVGLGTKTTDDLREVVRLIRDAGFDPYYSLSEPQS